MGTFLFDTQTLVVNQPLANLLNCVGDTEMTESEFNALITEHQQNEWSRAVEQLRQGKETSLEIELRVSERVIPVKIDAYPYIKESDKSAEWATLSFSNQTQIQQLQNQSALFKEQQRTLTGSNPLAIYYIDTELKITDCNRAFCAMFGVGINQVRGKSIDELDIFDTQFKALHKPVNITGNTRKETNIEANGETKTVKFSLLSYSIRSEKAGAIVTIEDLSEINALKKDIHNKQQALQNILDQSPLGIAVFDNEDKLTQANPALAEMIGKNKQEIEKLTFYQLFKTPEHAGTASRLLHKNGVINNLNVDLSSANDGVLNTRLDISRLEEDSTSYVCWISDMREQQFLSHQLERLMMCSTTPIAIMGISGFTQVNPAACAFFNIKDEDKMLGLSPADEEFNKNTEQMQEMADHIAKVHMDKAVHTLSWVHHINRNPVPCELMLIPLFDQGHHVATMCLWVDLRAIEKANAARLEAINLRQAAEREIAEQQTLLQSSQDLLANRARALKETQDKLQSAESDLANRMDTIHELQQAHQDISGHLQSLKHDYAKNHELLKQSEQANAELETQLQESSNKVGKLEKQRHDIANALQYSERKYKNAQDELARSEQTTKELKAEQAKQQANLEASFTQIEELRFSD